MQDELMTIPEVAEFLKVSRDTVYRWIKAGKLKKVKLAERGSSRIRRSDVERFIEQQAAETGA